MPSTSEEKGKKKNFMNCGAFITGLEWGCVCAFHEELGLKALGK
jgi:hypothetical protein